MKNLVFSFHGVFDTNPNYSKVSFVNHKKYCDKFNIDYLGTNNLIPKYDIPTHISFYRGMWIRFYIYQLLQKYDRIMWVDSDILFTDKCENMFELVQYQNMGVVKDQVAQKIVSNNGIFLQLFKTQYAKKLRYSYDNRDQFKKTSENFNLQKFDISNINKYIKDGI